MPERKTNTAAEIAVPAAFVANSTEFPTPLGRFDTAEQSQLSAV
jgi:hypothetical protein